MVVSRQMSPAGPLRPTQTAAFKMSKAGVNRLQLLLLFCAFLGLAACGSIEVTHTSNSDPTFTVSGTISGLVGSGLLLQDGGAVSLPVLANGPFTFGIGLLSGATYDVTVSAQPTSPSQTCTVTRGGIGTVAAANVTGVTLACTTGKYSVGGNVSGLTGSGLVLRDNGGDSLRVSASGSFTFATSIDSGAAYHVTVFAQPTSPNQTCTVTRGSGTVGAGNVSGVVVACTANSYTVGGQVSGVAGSGLVLRDDGGDNLSVSASGSFTFATAIASGSAYNVTVFTQPNTPNQHCVIARGTGMVTNANITSVTVVCRTDGRFVYVANNSNDVSAFTINPTTGALTTVAGSPFAAGTGPTAIAVDPGGKFAYAVNGVDGTVSAYTINAGTGALTAVAGSPFTVGANPQSVTVDPSGHFVYVANFDDNDVSAFTINATTGVLTAVAGSPFAADANAKFVTVEPAGRFAYVLNDGSRDVSVYSIDSTTGVLTELAGSPFFGVTGSGPFSMAISPNGQFAYVANNDGSNHISAFSIDTVTGAPTALADSPFFGVNIPWSVVIDPSGKFAYVADKGSNEVSGYTINAVTGDLTLMTGSPFATEINPRSIAVDPSGQFAYVGNDDSGDVSVYTIDATTGALTAVAGGPFLTDTGPVSIAISK